ncbi:hypothetical protein [Rhodococcus oxybenzonivorans]|uniref:hypothetical protein n=1 Tax=Rhodococcus oxybenzonivorans TaxID=1990687 RepID=UPI0013A55DB2|nr:hypothetical protein [Rhodococcus oxybenzonivorans]
MPSEIRVRVEDARSRTAKVGVTTPKGPFELHVDANVDVDKSATPWLPALSVVAMRLHSDLIFSDPVDALALSNLPHAQRILRDWYPRRYSSVRVEADEVAGSDAGSQRGVGCFFSGGVDSFHSAIAASERITHLIFVHGFDIKLSDVELAAKAEAGARNAAVALGKTLVVVRTNLRQLSDKARCLWGTDYHGAALATVAHSLSDHIHTALIPSSFQEADLHPWGTHPDLDPLWSSSAVRLEHYGTSLTRTEKIAFLARNDVAMDNLRVCWKNRDGKFNCGRCEKCVRTMVSLRAADGASRTLPHRVTPEAVNRLSLSGTGTLFALENLNALREARVRDLELETALEHAIRRGRTRDKVLGGITRRWLGMTKG